MNDLALRILKREEGWRAEPYYCSKGYPTVGYGFKIGSQNAPLPEFSLPRAAGEAWLNVLVSGLMHELRDRIGGLSYPRQAVIVSMAYQMGLTGLYGFGNMWRALGAGNYDWAAEEMRDSKWYREDTAARADRHAIVMQTGEAEPVYK